MANRPEPNSNHYNYPTAAQEERLSINVGNLHGTQPITLRTAVYETRTYGGVRGALRQFLAEKSTRLQEAFLCGFIYSMLQIFLY